MAFWDQLYLRLFAFGYPQGAQIFFWICKATLPQRMHKVWVLLRRLPNELVPLVCKQWHIFLLTITPQEKKNSFESQTQFGLLKKHKNLPFLNCFKIDRVFGKGS